jgi:Fe2+ or Zn2+ uptake regulation protein
VSTPDWANSATNPVLRLLADSGVALSPGAIVVNLNDRLERPPSRSTVTRALAGLRDQELVERVEPGRAYYLLTDAGQSYVSTHLDD